MRCLCGIDLVLHGRAGQLEYDFELAPGADPSRIRLQLHGGGRPTLDAAGNLIVEGAAGMVVQRAPVAEGEIVLGHHPSSVETVGTRLGP